MLKTGKSAALAILCALAITPAFAQDKAAAMVNGVAIPQTRIELGVKAAVAQGQTDSPELRKALRDNLINVEVLRQEAVKEGLDKNPDVVQQIELSSQQILVAAYLQDYDKKHPISDDLLKQEYDKLKVKLGDKEYNVRHILVESEEEAKSIIAQLNKKAKFEKLAAEKTKDAGSKDNGGSLGWVVPGSFVPPIANALLQLKKGDYTKDPVQSQFGWHVIRLDDIRDLKVPSLDELKPQLQQRLQQQAFQKMITDLRAKAKIE